MNEQVNLAWNLLDRDGGGESAPNEFMATQWPSGSHCVAPLLLTGSHYILSSSVPHTGLRTVPSLFCMAVIVTCRRSGCERDDPDTSANGPDSQRDQGNVESC